MKVLYLGGRQAGIIGLLTTLACGCKVKGVVTTSQILKDVAVSLGLPVYRSVKLPEVKALLHKVDLMISVHSREIVPEELLDISCLGGINVHPMLYRFKGADPVSRWLESGDSKGSVGVHIMTDVIDEGLTLCEIFKDIDRKTVKTVVDVYNELYPLYSQAIIAALRRLG